MEELENYDIVKLLRGVENRGMASDLRDLGVLAQTDFDKITNKIHLDKRQKIEPVRKLLDDIAHLRVRNSEEVKEAVSIFKAYIIPFLKEEERSKLKETGSTDTLNTSDGKRTALVTNVKSTVENTPRTGFSEQMRKPLRRGADGLVSAFRELYYSRPRELLLQDISKFTNSQILGFECLILIVEKLFKICKEEADLQIHRAEECARYIVETGKLNTDHQAVKTSRHNKSSDDLVRRYRYIHADLATERLQKIALQKVNTILYNEYNINMKENTNMMSFTRDCAEITWLMSVEDPAIGMVYDNNSGNVDERTYDIERRKPFNAILWPALKFECSKDSVLSKGIAWFK